MKTKKQIRKRIKELKSGQKPLVKNERKWKEGRFFDMDDERKYHALQSEIDVLQWVLREEE